MTQQLAVRHRAITMFFCAMTCLSAAAKEKSELEKAIDQSLERYQVFEVGEPEPLPFIPVLTWNNPFPGGAGQFRTVLHIKDGQPKSVCCIWASERRIYHEFSPMTRSAMRGELDGKQVWNFNEDSLKFRPLPHRENPAKDRRARFSQMQTAIRRFAAIELQDRDGKASTERLRLLPAPLYRYEKESATILDGAVFCLVHTTAPELLVVIECLREEKGARWEYAIVRRTTLPVEAELDKRKVWSTEQVGYQAFTQIAYKTAKH